MVSNTQIQQWLSGGVITQEQANKMLSDTTEHQKEESSNKFIIAISTIGSILLGVGAILFIASNWEAIPDIIKTLLLIISTFTAYYTGYALKYQTQKLPKVGSSLLFLGVLLFGATLFLLAQIYNIPAGNHLLVFLWLISILPFAYAFLAPEMAVLAALLFYLWITLYVLQDFRFSIFGGTSSMGNFFHLPVLYLVSGVLLFDIGGIHYFSVRLKKIARIFRLSGIRMAVFSLFLLSFRFFSGNYNGYNIRGDALASDGLTIMLTGFAVFAVIGIFINFFFNPSKSQTPGVEFYTGLGLISIAMLFFNFPAESNIYVIFFNLALAGIIIVLLQQGYMRRDMDIVNIGLSFFTVFLIARYFDLFWGLMDRSIFFMLGGIVLLIGGIALEGKRREIKVKFTQHT